MRESDLRPANQHAIQYGVKSLVYGPPGSAKTPVTNTAPRPVLLAVEPGLLSMRGSTVPTYVAPTWAKIKEFFDWVKSSNEVRNYDTICVDSVSQVCEIFLRDNPTKVQHGLKLYGDMAVNVGDILHNLYYMQNKHTYLICKQEVEQIEGGGGKRRPYFPGNDLKVKVPHLFDEILHLDLHAVPGMGTTRAFHCHSAFDAYCRDRTGMLAEYEPPNLTALFNKCMTPPTTQG